MTLKVVSWNAHSLRNKFTELSILIDRFSIDIVLISESWLTPDITFDIPGFTSYRSDRSRGGVAIFIRSSIPHFGFTKYNYDYAESCSISVSIDNMAVKISSIYCSPSASRAQSYAFFYKVLSQTGPHIVAGDFNCKHLEWNNVSSDRKGSDLFHLTNSLNYSILKPDEPTLYPYVGEPSTVDLVMAKNFASLSPIQVLNDLSSDHLPLLFSIHGVNSHQASDCPDLSKVNWPKYLRLVEANLNLLMAIDFSSHDVIDSSVDSIASIISSALIASAPMKCTSSLRYRFSHSINILIRNRNHFRNLFKRSRDPALKSSVNLLNRMIRQQVFQEKKTAFERKLQSLSFKDNSLFRFAKHLKRKKSTIPPIADSIGTHFSDKDKADAFARSFQSSFNAVHNSHSKYESLVSSSIMSISNSRNSEFDLISPDDVKLVLQTLNSRKAPGHDKIPNCALKVLSVSTQFVSLCSNIFNACIKLSYFPKSWKIAKIIPISKSNQNCSSPDNFRPISLLSCLGKCFERIILMRLNDFEFDNNIIIKQQCGFRSNHSTVHQILRITEKISFGFNKNKSTGMALLDLRKAFDSVWHDGLIHKLFTYNYPLYLIKLLQSYLSDRSAFVACNSAFSYLFDVTSGVPQGSLIAPHLFNVFINDIPIPPKGQLSLYADDTAFLVQFPWKNLKSIKAELCKTVRILQVFFSDWKIHLNESKTEFIIFTKSTKMLQKLRNDSISFNNQSFEWKESVKYLGINLDCKLLFRCHIENAINKASAASFSSLYCLLSRNSFASLDSKLRIYKAIIRPILTYACPIFINAARCHLNKLQIFQNKILRMILNINWYDFQSVREFHDSAKVPLIIDFMSRLTDNFYAKVAHHTNDLFSSLGQYDYNSLGFRAKHKLPKPIH